MPEHADQFLLSRQAALRSPATVAFYQRSIGAFESWRGDRPLNSSTVREFLVHKSATCNGGGIHAFARAIRACARFPEAEGVNGHVYIVMPTVGEPSRPCPLQKDVMALLQAARRPRDRFLVILLADTGIRLS